MSACKRRHGVKSIIKNQPFSKQRTSVHFSELGPLSRQWFKILFQNFRKRIQSISDNYDVVNYTKV